MMKKRFKGVSIGLMAAIALLSACSSASPSASDTTAAEDSAPAAPEASSQNQLVIAISGDFGHLGEQQNGKMLASFAGDTLFTCIQNDKGSFEYVTEGSIVDSCEWINDNMALRLHLAENVKMHDDTILDAYDIEFSLKYSSENFPNTNINIDYDNIAVEDTYTIVVPFKSVQVSNWNDIGARYIYSKEAAEATDNYELFCQSSEY